MYFKGKVFKYKQCKKKHPTYEKCTEQTEEPSNEKDNNAETNSKVSNTENPQNPRKSNDKPTDRSEPQTTDPKDWGSIPLQSPSHSPDDSIVDN